MLSKLPIQVITRLNSSGTCQAALKLHIPHEESPVIARLYASLRKLYFDPTSASISSRRKRGYRSLTVSYNVLRIESLSVRCHLSEYAFTKLYVGVPGESEISPGSMKMQIITGIFFRAMRLSIASRMRMFPSRSLYE